MQTKKRAKPVKFGKDKEEKITKKVAEADINSPEAKEIKKIIEEKTHPKDEEETEVNLSEVNEPDEEKKEDDTKEGELAEQEETTDDEPAEIRLSEEPPEKKEEKMALETTEPVAEVEPEELQEKEKIEEPSNDPSVGSFTNDAVKKEAKKGFLGFFLLVAFITFLVGIGIIATFSYFLPSDTKKSVALPSFNTATPTPTEEPTATPTPAKVDLSAYTIRVLNGSGITGEAAKVKTMLEDKEFKVASLGNAATSDYTKTIITAKDDVEEAYLNTLIKTLQEHYRVNSVVEDAPSSQTADVVVTIGSDSAE